MRWGVSTRHNVFQRLERSPDDLSLADSSYVVVDSDALVLELGTSL